MGNATDFNVIQKVQHNYKDKMRYNTNIEQ